VSPVDVINDIWNQILDVTSIFILPDWGGLIGLLPILVVIGLVGPFLTFLALGTFIYILKKPRVKVRYQEGPKVAEIGADGEPIFPAGLPYCRRDALIYPSGTARCTTCHDQLSVICPMCQQGRSALFDTCPNCGLILKVRKRTEVITVATGPKPGGAAAA
jgi:hypothetical protein